MKKLTLALIVGLGFGLLGCSGSSDSGTPNTEPLKTAADLPKDMPPEAKQQAEAAMAQQNAMADQMKRNAPPPNVGRN